MSTTVDRQRKARPGWWRLMLALALTALTAGLAVGAAPGTASAAYTCLNPPDDSYELQFENNYMFDPDTGTFRKFVYPDGHTHQHVLLHFYIHQVVPTFNVAAQAFVDNGTDDVQMGTFATQQSQTFSITESVSTGIQSTFMQTVFSSTVSQSITRSITTSTTITASGPVPPHSRVNADFGVDAYIVTYSVAYWELADGRCWWHGNKINVVDNVPTTRQGWRVYPATPI